MRSIAAALTLLLAGAQGDGDNFRYTHWSSFKPGSWVRLKLRSVDPTLGGVDSLQKIVLVGVDKDKATLTSSTAVILIEALEPQFSDPEKFEITRKGSKESLKPGPDDEIEIAGKKMKCRTFTCQDLNSGVVYNKKFWINTDVPGGIVRQEIRPASGKGFEVTSVAEVWGKK